MKTKEHKNPSSRSDKSEHYGAGIKTKKHSKLPKSIRKYIRIEKAKIRHHESDPDKQTELINQLYLRFGKTVDNN